MQLKILAEARRYRVDQRTAAEVVVPRVGRRSAEIDGSWSWTRCSHVRWVGPLTGRSAWALEPQCEGLRLALLSRQRMSLPWSAVAVGAWTPLVGVPAGRHELPRRTPLRLSWAMVSPGHVLTFPIPSYPMPGRYSLSARYAMAATTEAGSSRSRHAWRSER